MLRAKKKRPLAFVYPGFGGQLRSGWSFAKILYHEPLTCFSNDRTRLRANVSRASFKFYFEVRF